MRAGVLFMSLLLLAGCARSSGPVAVLTAEERQLVVQLTRDPFVIVDATTREDDGYVTLRTRQADTIAYYRLMPTGDAKPELVIRRLDEQLHLPVAWSEDQLGTGPAPRGIHR